MAPGISVNPRRPICNDKVEEWVRNRHLQAHKNNIARSKSSISNQWSVREETKLQVSRKNAKKEQLAEERYTGIEKENRRLLDRMQQIERKGSQKAAAQLVLGTPKPSGPAAAPRSASVPTAGSRVSVRVKELRRIDAENQRLLKRLQGAKSAVRMSKNDEDYKAQQRYMKMHCEHQKDDWIVERAQEQALLIARMEERAAARAPLPDPAPLSKEPAGPTDAECLRLLHLQDKLRARAEHGEEEDEEDSRSELAEVQESDDQQEREVDADPEGTSPSQKQTSPKKKVGMSYAGVIPDASQNLVDQLMAEYAEQQAQEEQDSQADADAAKAAAAAAFREAEALDVASDDVFLSYERVVRNRKDKEREYEHDVLNGITRDFGR